MKELGLSYFFKVPYYSEVMASVFFLYKKKRQQDIFLIRILDYKQNNLIPRKVILKWNVINPNAQLNLQGLKKHHQYLKRQENEYGCLTS